MSHTKQTKTKPQKYLIFIVAALIGILVIFLLFNRPAPPPRNSGLYPQNGTYKISEVPNIQCTFSHPPTCSGNLIVGEDELTRTEVFVDRDTKVRYQNKEIQIYPSELKAGMTGHITFKPDSAIIESMVIAD